MSDKHWKVGTVCVNGCNEPVQPPSKVLCKKCLDALSDKITKLCGRDNG